MPNLILARVLAGMLLAAAAANAAPPVLERLPFRGRRYHRQYGELYRALARSGG